MFLTATMYAVVAESTGSDLTDATDDVPLLILGIVGVVSVVGWWRDRAKRAAADEEAQRKRDRLESELQERESDIRETREQLEFVWERENEHQKARE
jgi:hypothetical protein